MLVLGAGWTQDLTVSRSAGEFEIKLSKAVEQDFRLTRSQPVEFAVTGPAWVRVYSRLVWHAGMAAGEQYELVLRKPDGARRETLRTDVSAATRGPDGEVYAKWRSFYIRVPGGRNNYRLTLGMARADTLAVRFALEAPPAPREAEPQATLPRLNLRRDSTDTGYYLVEGSSETPLLLVGPVRVAVEGRLNFVKGMTGKQAFALTVYENDLPLTSREFEVRRMKAFRWVGRDDIRPSAAERIVFDLPAGAHAVAVRFRASGGRTGALRFLVWPKGAS
jgi:hypothetical protein